MPKISLISPVFKAEKYVKRCVESILQQSFQNWELILVDDGSPDKSGDLCDECARLDSRISVIHKTNGGVSSARNAGLANAVGEWIFFIDIDDTIEPDALCTLYGIISQRDVDCVLLNVNMIDTDGNIALIKHPFKETQILDKQTVESMIMLHFCTGELYLNSPCSKLYKKKIIEDNRLFFEKRIRGEDWLFNVAYFKHVSSIAVTEKPLYNYIRNDESAMAQYCPEQFRLWTENWHTRQNLIKEYNLPVDQNRMKRDMMLKTFYFLQIIKSKDHSTHQKQRLREVLQSKLLKECLRCYPSSIRELRVWIALQLLRLSA